MTIRDWTMDRLEEVGFRVQPIGGHGIVIDRESKPNAYVYCPNSSELELYTARHLQQALEAMPQLQFVVISRRDISHDIYQLADKSEVAVGSLPDLKRALVSDDNVGAFRTTEQKYLARRFTVNAQIQNWARWGRAAYELNRPGTLRTLRIITIDHYELTADGIYGVLEEYGSPVVDAIVSTNPNCRGFSPVAHAAARDACVRVMTLREFFDTVRDSWT